jgi:pimeloyl-ACP methyl ester carboxylesterase
MKRIGMQTGNPEPTRRQLLKGAGAWFGTTMLISGLARGEEAASRKSSADPFLVKPHSNDVAYGKSTLPLGVRSRFVDNNNGVTMHVLDAGFEGKRRPCVVLLHGFPELAYTWRKQLLPLAKLGFHVVAPDLRGVGRSATTPVAYDDDVLPYSIMNRVSDVLGLVRALGYEQVAAVVGHDWSGPVAAWCARIRPDVFRSVVSMSTPFFGAPYLPFNSANEHQPAPTKDDKRYDLSALTPPRKHYQDYFTTRGANEDLWHAPQGVQNLLRAQYYFKSADWQGNKPFPLKSSMASEMAKMPKYYIMDLDRSYAETMAAEMPTQAYIAKCKWLTDEELQVFATEYTRTGFQGGLNLYRIFEVAGDLNAFSGRKINVPALYIAGASEWGAYQSPGALEDMKNVCTQLVGSHFVQSAGHSIPEEQPEAVNQLIIDFLRRVNA